MTLTFERFGLFFWSSRKIVTLLPVSQSKRDPQSLKNPAWQPVHRGEFLGDDSLVAFTSSVRGWGISGKLIFQKLFPALTWFPWNFCGIAGTLFRLSLFLTDALSPMRALSIASTADTIQHGPALASRSVGPCQEKIQRRR